MHISPAISQEPLCGAVLPEHVNAYGPVFKITDCELEHSVSSLAKSCPIYAIDVYTTVA